MTSREMRVGGEQAAGEGGRISREGRAGGEENGVRGKGGHMGKEVGQWGEDSSRGREWRAGIKGRRYGKDGYGASF